MKDSYELDVNINILSATFQHAEDEEKEIVYTIFQAEVEKISWHDHCGGVE